MDEQAERRENDPPADPAPPSGAWPAPPAWSAQAPAPPPGVRPASPPQPQPEQPAPEQPLPQPPAPQPPLAARQVPPPPREAWAQPVRIEPMAGTPYGLAILGAPAATSGPAVGALICGIGSILVSFLVTCFGLIGAADGWGVWVAGAFAILAGCLGVAGVGLGIGGIRQTGRRLDGNSPRVTGRGVAVSGLVCGGLSLLITICVLGVVVMIQLV